MAQVPSAFPTPTDAPENINPKPEGYKPPYQHVDVPLAAFGGATAAATGKLGEGIQQAGSDLSDIATKQAMMAADTFANNRALEVSTKLTNARIDFMSKNQGENAASNAPALYAQLDQIAKDGVQGMGPYATNATQRVLNSHIQTEKAAIGGFVQQQTQQAYLASADSKLALIQQDVINSVDNPKATQEGMSLAYSTLTDKMTKLGQQNTPAMQEAWSKFVSNTVSGAVRMKIHADAVDGTNTAAGYLAAHRADINSADYANLSYDLMNMAKKGMDAATRETLTFGSPQANADTIEGIKQRSQPPAAQPVAPDLPGPIMQKEGGYRAADSNGQAVNMGITQGALAQYRGHAATAEDVKNLTPAEARDIINKQYAGPIGAANMSPAFAAVATDTAVNKGVAGAAPLIRQANGDPQKLIDLRRADYQNLADSNPKKYGSELAGWNNRLDQLEKELPPPAGAVPALSNTPAFLDAIKHNQEIDAQVRGDGAGLVLEHPAGAAKFGMPDMNALFQKAGTGDAQAQSDWKFQMDRFYDLKQIPQGERHYLPASTAQNAVKDLVSDPASAQGKLLSTEKQWGDLWPEMYADMGQLGKLPSGFELLANLDPRNADLLAQGMQQQAKNGKSLEDLLTPPVYNELHKAVYDDPAVKQFTASLAATGVGVNETDGYAKGIVALAAMQMRSGTGDVASAIKASLGMWGYLPGSNARVPAGTEGVMEANADYQLGQITKDNIITPESTRAPGAAQNEAQYLTNLKANPTWITSPRGNGLLLQDAHYRLVRDIKGNPIFIPFSNTMSPGASPSTNTLTPYGMAP